MDAACCGRAFVYMNAMSADALVDPFWRHFHGGPRKAAPTYLDAVAMLCDLGIEPVVEVVEVHPSYRFADLPTAVRSYCEMLVLRDTAAVRAELRLLLSSWLVEDHGVLRPPIRTTPAAVISWAGRGRADS